ncbi:MAG: hypothetical protein P0S96_02400 [Simkaniaceae bacterium]|nr:hypothetical protein [Candidatus Sacchlamyda saccharinae]
MKKAKALVLFLHLSALYAEPLIPENSLNEKINMQPTEDELVTIERIIFLTEKQLKAQKKIKILIQEIQHNKEMFMKSEESKLHAEYMVQASKNALHLIRTHHLYHLFSSDFMEDLAIYSAIGSKHD